MSRLARRLREIDGRRTALLDDLAAADQSLLAATPIEGKWSILGIIEHLVLAERFVLDRVDSQSNGRKRSLKNRALYLLVMFILRYDIPVRVPSKEMLPGGARPLEDLRREWDENHCRLREYVAGLDPISSREAVFRHPVAGPMTPPQAIRMLDVHLSRHIRQIRKRQRLLKGQ